MRISIPPEERFAIVNPSLSSAISASPTPWALAWQVGAQPATVVADEEPQLGGSDRGGDLDGPRTSPDTRA
jgi:hypothetical protein